MTNIEEQNGIIILVQCWRLVVLENMFLWNVEELWWIDITTMLTAYWRKNRDPISDLLFWLIHIRLYRLTLFTYPYPTYSCIINHDTIKRVGTKFIFCFLSHTIGTWEKVSHRVISIQYSNHPAYCCFSDVVSVFWFTNDTT